MNNYDLFTDGLHLQIFSKDPETLLFSQNWRWPDSIH